MKKIISVKNLAKMLKVNPSYFYYNLRNSNILVFPSRSFIIVDDKLKALLEKKGLQNFYPKIQKEAEKDTKLLSAIIKSFFDVDQI